MAVEGLSYCVCTKSSMEGGVGGVGRVHGMGGMSSAVAEAFIKQAHLQAQSMDPDEQEDDLVLLGLNY